MTWSLIWAAVSALRQWSVRKPLTTAFTLSLAVHLALFGGWKLGEQLGWWKHQATWLLDLAKKRPSKAQLAKLVPKPAPPTRQEIPLTFVEVDPSTAVPDAPDKAKYYGAHSSKAANPDPKLETTTPKIEGKQDKLVRLENVPKPGPQPLQPIFPEPPKPEPKPKDSGTDLTVEQPKPDKPRTLAKAMEQNKMLAGRVMRQDGGVGRRGKYSLDVVGSSFGTYDAAIIAAIQQRWYDLLDNTPFTHRAGKVVLEFHLNIDGSVSAMHMLENEVGENLAGLCQRAIADPAPFGRWPEDMRKKVGKDYREVLFTFYYE